MNQTALEPVRRLRQTMSGRASPLKSLGAHVAHAAASWIITRFWSPTMTVPVRGAPSMFGATLKATVPLPVPFAADVSMTKAAPVVALQRHSGGATIAKLPLPPEAGNAWLPGETVIPQ